MADVADDRLAEGKLDLVPMIDCIMLLLLFFILTTKFTSEEKSIASLLPTDKGQSAATPTKVEPPQQINIRIYPPDMGPALQPSEYEAALRQIQTPSQPVINTAWLRIGPNDLLVIDGKILGQKGGEGVSEEVERVHQYIYAALEKFETGNTADRKSQCAVTIHCFSQLSWKYALVAYDAVRAYEAKHSGRQATGDPKDFDDAREVDFAPPRIRDYSQHELGNELYEIVNMK